jgi:hypothetical protein
VDGIYSGSCLVPGFDITSVSPSGIVTPELTTCNWISDY